MSCPSGTKVAPSLIPAAVLSATPYFLPQFPFSGKRRYICPAVSATEASSNFVEVSLVNFCEGTGTGFDHPPGVAPPTIKRSAGNPCCCVNGVTVNLPVWKSTMILYKPDVEGPGKS